MSFRRKKYDEDIFGGDLSASKRGNTLSNKSASKQHDTPKKSRKRFNRFRLEEEDNFTSDESIRDRYLLTYSDLITLLLGLFIILYAISNVDLTKYKKMTVSLGEVFGAKSNTVTMNNIKMNPKIIAIPVVNTKQDLKNKLSKLIAINHYNNSIKFSEDKRGIIIHILDKILYPTGGADLAGKSLKVLNQIGNILKKIPNDIRIEGHTDNIPIHTKRFPSNWHLSVARALNTAYYLITKDNLPADRVTIVGYSKYKPIKSNSTLEGRRMNRRVDIVVLNK